MKEDDSSPGGEGVCVERSGRRTSDDSRETSRVDDRRHRGPRTRTNEPLVSTDTLPPRHTRRPDTHRSLPLFLRDTRTRDRSDTTLGTAGPRDSGGDPGPRHLRLWGRGPGTHRDYGRTDPVPPRGRRRHQWYPCPLPPKGVSTTRDPYVRGRGGEGKRTETSEPRDSSRRNLTPRDDETPKPGLPWGWVATGGWGRKDPGGDPRRRTRVLDATTDGGRDPRHGTPTSPLT